MGFFGDTSSIRASAGSLGSIADDLDRFARQLPAGIPTGAWSGPAASAWNATLPLLQGHLSRIGSALHDGERVLSQLAVDLDSLNERYDAQKALGFDVGDLRVMDIVFQAELAKRQVASELTSLAHTVQLATGMPYSPPVAPQTEGMTSGQKAAFAADMAGVVDPTPISDLTATVLSLSNGDLLGAGLSFVGVIPYIGDTAKGLKYGGKVVKDLDVAAETLKVADDVGESVSLGRVALRQGDSIMDIATAVEFGAGASRMPYSTFADAGYAFVADESGRTVLVSGVLRREKAARSGLETTIGRLGIEGDQGGHLFAARFGGPSSTFNLTPQASTFNQSTYKTLENEWDRLLTSGHQVDVSVRLNYPTSTSIRPDGFLVEHSIDGVEQEARYFINE